MNDLHEQIMINLDIDTLQNFCSTTKNKCNNFNFWIKKFKYDGVYIFTTNLPKTSQGWIKEYKKSQQAYTIALRLYQTVFLGADEGKNNLSLAIHNLISDFLPFEVRDSSTIIFNFLRLYISHHNLRYHIDEKIKYNNIEEMFYVLAKLLYYDLDIVFHNNKGKQILLFIDDTNDQIRFVNKFY